MGLKAPKGNNTSKVEQEKLEAGNYPARLVQVIDMGLQPQRAYQGQDKPPAQEVMLTYEFVDEFLKDENGKDREDKPRWLSETIPLRSLSSELAKSTKRYNVLDPDGLYEGDFSKCINSPVMVALVRNGDYENVGGVSVMRPKDAEKCPELVNPPKVFDLSNPDMEIFGSLPEWVREKIKGNLNYRGSKLHSLIEGVTADDEPSEEDVPW